MVHISLEWMIRTDLGAVTIGLRPPMTFDPRGNVAAVLIFGTIFSNQARSPSLYKDIPFLPSVSMMNIPMDLRIYRETIKCTDE